MNRIEAIKDQTVETNDPEDLMLLIMEALNDAIDQWYDYHTRAAQEFKRMQSMLPHLPNKADATERARFRLVD